MEFFLELLALRPRRELRLRPPLGGAIVIASDAQCDASPSGGYLIVDTRTGERVGAWTVFPPEVLAEWGFSQEALDEGASPIQCCGCAMIPIAIRAEAERLRGRQVLWFVDNTSALRSLVKGCSNQAHVDRSVGLAHLVACEFRISLWFEYVDSHANWADGISRELGDDPFARQHGFRVTEVPLCPEPWRGSLSAAWGTLRGQALG
jgi:hypothetical protein